MPQKPLLIYDGDCGFCRRWIERWRRVTGDRVDYAPYQEVASRFPDIAPETFATAVQLVLPDGSVVGGAHAVFRALATAPHRRWPLWAYRHVPGAAALAEVTYALVAHHRTAASRLTTLVLGGRQPPHYDRTRRLFLAGLGLVYAIAFASLAVQIRGLVGRHGIAPVETLLAQVASRLGPERYHLLPSLFWLNASDTALVGACWLGAVLALLVVIDVAPAPALLLSWLLYLSLLTCCDVFLHYQWDILLLETGFLAIFLAPLHVRPGARATVPSRAVLLALRWLLFRLMLLSGLVKWLSGDPTWRQLTALEFHYETQPLPTWIAWYAHQLPAWMQRVSVGSMFVVELVFPFLVFGPRAARLLTCIVFIGFQLLIMLTGNYGFFNLLTITLSLCLLDDDALGLRRRRQPAVSTRPSPVPGPAVAPRRWPPWITGPLAAGVIMLSLLPTSRRLGLDVSWPAVIERAYGLLQPLRLVNAYGLFTVMTTRRPEITIEGSIDGRQWRAYEFRWKPGSPQRPPAFVEPHQPRLDWQMWFAALGSYQQQAWFQRFLLRLLEGAPEVRALLAVDPFPDGPPLYIRASIADYRFTDLATRRSTGRWWTIGPARPYAPVLRRRGP